MVLTVRHWRKSAGNLPIEDFTGKNWLLEFGTYSVEKPSITSLHAIRKGLTYSSALRIRTQLTNKQTGKIASGEVFLGEIPHMTLRGTFIVNGVERAVINQIIRSPGVYFGVELDAASGKLLHTAELRPIRGTWLEFEISRGGIISIRIDRRKNSWLPPFYAPWACPNRGPLSVLV